MEKRLELIAFCLSIILVFALTIFLSFIFYAHRTCNDGTPYDKCSGITPYFCSRGKLIEKASVCGCGTMQVQGESCLSAYQEEPKNITLEYVLRGRKGEIDFVVYGKLAENLSQISRYANLKENPSLLSFKLKMINNQEQRELLLPLVVEIEKITKDKTDQARIAISLVQKIPFGSSDKKLKVGNIDVDYQRYPYEVLYDMEAICSEKSELMIFLLRELGYSTSSLYYNLENHEAVGIKCPSKRANAGEFCFIETTGPSIISDDRTEYFGIVDKLISIPIVTNISEGMSLGENIYEYNDAETLADIRDDMRKYGTINPVQYLQFKNLERKYGLLNPDEYTF